jgi:hypothetical protein
MAGASWDEPSILQTGIGVRNLFLSAKEEKVPDFFFGP